jgi:membrane protein
MVAACAFLYVFIPNTRVRFGAALAGGVAAGLRWRLAGWLFGLFVAGSAQYQAIYSSFAILVVFMIWLYVSWLILLLGVDIAYHVQHPADPGLGRQAGRAAFRRAGLATIGLVGQRFLRGEPPLNPDELASQSGLPGRDILEALEALRQRGLVLEVEQDGGAYLPARDLGALPLREILDALDGAEAIAEQGGPAAAPEQLLRRLREAEHGALKGMSLRQWLEAADADESGM